MLVLENLTIVEFKKGSWLLIITQVVAVKIRAVPAMVAVWGETVEVIIILTVWFQGILTEVNTSSCWLFININVKKPIQLSGVQSKLVR